MNGRYVAARLDNKSSELLYNYCIENKIPNFKNKEDFHCTIAYSKVDFIYVHKNYNLKINKLTYELDTFDTRNLIVLKFKSDFLQKRFNTFINLGATYDYEFYNPHITLTTDSNNFNINNLKLPDFDIILTNEYSEDIINENK